MKKLRRLLTALVLLPITVSASYNAGMLSVNDTVRFPILCIDTLRGFDAAPDSAYVVTYYHGEGDNDSTYFARTIAAGAGAAWIDSARMVGLTGYYFVDIVGNIDADRGNGPYSGDVITWYQTKPFHNRFSFTKLGDEARDYYARITEILDTLRNQDDWVSSLTTDDNIGVNLDDVSGTLDAAEIGTDAITGAKIANNAIGNSEIAAGAFQSTHFSNGAIWSDAISLPAANKIAAQVWRARDTAHVDSSDIGLWLVNNLSGSTGSDSTSIARWVWNTPQANHTTQSTFGKYLDTEISGISAGSGLYAYTVQAFDSTLSQVVPSVRVTVRNISQSALMAVAMTDSEGRADLNLDADSFVVVTDAPGYIFTAYDTIVVSGTGVDTVFGYRFDPGSPESPELCRVYGYVTDLRGQPQQSLAVTASLPKGVVRSAGQVVSPYAVSTSTDTSGYFFLDLIPSDSLTGESVMYEISICRDDGTILRKRMEIPAQQNWQLIW